MKKIIKQNGWMLIDIALIISAIIATPFVIDFLKGLA
jgi:hypothetical protein